MSTIKIYDWGEPAITNEPVEFDNYPVEVQDCRRIIDRFIRRNHRTYPKLIIKIK